MIDQWGSYGSSIGRDSSQSVTSGSWLTTATRTPWRAAFAIVLKA